MILIALTIFNFMALFNSKKRKMTGKMTYQATIWPIEKKLMAYMKERALDFTIVQRMVNDLGDGIIFVADPKNRKAAVAMANDMLTFSYDELEAAERYYDLEGKKTVAAYVVLGINSNGKKEVITIEVGENESSKYWLSVLNELKNRGVKDILIICADGLSGIKEAIAAAYPKTEYQRCIVHQVRNTLKYVADKDRKPFANDLKTIYQAPSEEQALEALERVTEKWSVKYPNSMKSWKQNWDAISPIFKFSTEVRKVIYTTNAIESLNSTYRKLNRQRSVFPSDTALLKALYLATFEATKKWTMPIRNWGQVYGELSIMYEGRLPE